MRSDRRPIQSFAMDKAAEPVPAMNGPMRSGYLFSPMRGIVEVDTTGHGSRQPITGYHLDEEGHWVAQLACGHNQHVRHDPPLVVREWVQSPQGRNAMIGFELVCKKCLEGAPADARPPGDGNEGREKGDASRVG